MSRLTLALVVACLSACPAAADPKRVLALDDLYRFDGPRDVAMSPDGKSAVYVRQWIDPATKAERQASGGCRAGREAGRGRARQPGGPRSKGRGVSGAATRPQRQTSSGRNPPAPLLRSGGAAKQCPPACGAALITCAPAGPAPPLDYLRARHSLRPDHGSRVVRLGAGWWRGRNRRTGSTRSGACGRPPGVRPRSCCGRDCRGVWAPRSRLGPSSRVAPRRASRSDATTSARRRGGARGRRGRDRVLGGPAGPSAGRAGSRPGPGVGGDTGGGGTVFGGAGGAVGTPGGSSGVGSGMVRPFHPAPSTTRQTGCHPQAGSVWLRGRPAVTILRTPLPRCPMRSCSRHPARHLPRRTPSGPAREAPPRRPRRGRGRRVGGRRRHGDRRRHPAGQVKGQEAPLRAVAVVSRSRGPARSRWSPATCS